MSTDPEKGSTFCKHIAALLVALGSGGRHGYDQPYLGGGCTYKWFSSTEICMIMERFNAIVFLGDDIVQTIYAAFNILLREDLVLGSLQHSLMNQQEKYDCKCDNQFLDLGCLQYAIKAQGDTPNNMIRNGKESPYFCKRKSIFSYTLPQTEILTRYSPRIHPFRLGTTLSQNPNRLPESNPLQTQSVATEPDDRVL